MLEESDSVIRMIAQEAIKSLQFNRLLDEAAVRDETTNKPVNVVDTDILGRLVRGENESDELVKIRSIDVAAKLAIAPFKISQSDSDAFKKGKVWEHITGVTYEHEEPINLLKYVKSVEGFSKISKKLKDGVRILSLGEIYDKIESDSEAARIKKFSDLMRAKIACIIRVIQSLENYTKRRSFEASLDMFYTAAQAESVDVTPELLSNMKQEAEDNVNSNLIGSSEALSKLDRLKNTLENWAVAELASEGKIIVGADVKDLGSAEAARDHLVKNNQGSVLSKLNSIYRMGENSQTNPADLAKGPMHVAVVNGTNSLLSMMGLGNEREKGKGLAGYRNLPNNQIASIAGLPIEYIEELGLAAAIEKVEQEIRVRKRETSNPGILKILRKYGSAGGTLSDAERSARDSPERIASRESASSLGIRREDSLGGKTESYDSRIAQAKFIAPLRRIAQSINKHSYQIFPSRDPNRVLPGQWIALAFNVFAGPIARAITEARFSDMSALAKLIGEKSVTADEIRFASERRPSANDLKRLPSPDKSRSVTPVTTGDYTLDRLLTCFTPSKFGDLQDFLDERDPNSATSKDAGVSIAVFEAVKKAAKYARGVPQNDIIGAKILSSNGIYTELKVVLEPVENDANIVAAISGAYDMMGGKLGDLIRDIAKGKDINNIMEYIEGSCLEPIREDDIKAMEATIDFAHNEERSQKRSAKTTQSPATPRNVEPKIAAEKEIPQEAPVYDTNPFDDDLSESRLLEALHRVLIRKASAGQPRV